MLGQINDGGGQDPSRAVDVRDGSAPPGVKSMSAMTDAQRTKIVHETAMVMEHLLTVSCQSEAKQAVQYEGNSALEASFNVLGQVAGA